MFRFVDFIGLDNDIAGIEYIEASASNSPWGGAMIKDSLIVGHSKLRDINSFKTIIKTQTNCTSKGIMLPFSARLTVSNVTLVNFDEPGCIAFGTCAHCKPLDGGAIIRLNNLTFQSSPNVVKFPFNHASVLYDEDGTLTGYRGVTDASIYEGILDPNVCFNASNTSYGVPGAICKYGDFAKVAWNELKPSYLDEKDAYLCNVHGCDTVKWRKKSKTLFKGYTAFLPINHTVSLSFQDSTHLTNISYNMAIDELPPSSFAFINHTFKQTPDFFTTIGESRNNTEEFPVANKYRHGDWFYQEDAQNLTYLIDGEWNDPLKPG